MNEILEILGEIVCLQSEIAAARFLFVMTLDAMLFQLFTLLVAESGFFRRTIRYFP